MKILDEGYEYSLASLEGDTAQVLRFKKTREENGELIPIQDGTSNEEVIKALINRLHFLNEWMYDSFNSEALIHLEQALNALHARQADRKARGVLGTTEM